MFNTDQALDFISTTRVNTTQYKQSRQSPLEMNRSGFLRAVIANYWVITLFNNAINKINAFNTLPEAISFINGELSSAWDKENSLVLNFMDLVERRFMA